MPTTRRQEAIREGRVRPEPPQKKQRVKRGAKGKKKGDGAEDHMKVKHEKEEKTETAATGTDAEVGTTNAAQVQRNEAAKTGEKREAQRDHVAVKEEPPAKKAKTEGEAENEPTDLKDAQEDTQAHDKEGIVYEEGTIERGHIYFFYRPKVEIDEVESSSDVQRLHMLLVPRPPAFAVTSPSPTPIGAEKLDAESSSAAEMKILALGADAVPAPQTTEKRGRGFWGVITAVGEDMEGIFVGTRHQGPARLLARGAYALVNEHARTPSARKTYLGYRISHPAPSDFGDVQTELGLHPASSYIVQIRNPLAPAMTSQQAQSHGKEAMYPEWIMQRIFKGRGNEGYGIKFASCEVPEMLDYPGAQVLLLPSRQDEEGLETSLGEGRGQALNEAGNKESQISTNHIFEELGADMEKFPVEPLNGEWI